MQIYVDGRFRCREDAHVSVFDHGLLYGDGVFEGIRVYGGGVFELHAHVDRLYRSAQSIALDIPLAKEAMVEAVLETTRRNDLSDGYLRLVVTRGEGGLGLNPAKCPRATVIIIAAPLQLYPEEAYRLGLKVVTCSTRRNPPQCVNGAVKSLNYLNNILAMLELRDTGAHEGVMLTIDGYLCECTADNLFLIRDQTLMTPSPAVGALRGITRDIVMSLASSQLGLAVEEGLYSLHDLYNADEAFLTGTAAEVAPIVEADKRWIGAGVPGPITTRLIDLYRTHAYSSGTLVDSIDRAGEESVGAHSQRASA